MWVGLVFGSCYRRFHGSQGDLKTELGCPMHYSYSHITFIKVTTTTTTKRMQRGVTSQACRGIEEVLKTWKNFSLENQFSGLVFLLIFVIKTCLNSNKNTSRMLTLLPNFVFKWVLVEEKRNYPPGGTWKVAHSNWKWDLQKKRVTTKVLVDLQN